MEQLESRLVRLYSVSERRSLLDSLDKNGALVGIKFHGGKKIERVGTWKRGKGEEKERERDEALDLPISNLLGRDNAGSRAVKKTDCSLSDDR